MSTMLKLNNVNNARLGCMIEMDLMAEVAKVVFPLLSHHVTYIVPLKPVHLIGFKLNAQKCASKIYR